MHVDLFKRCGGIYDGLQTVIKWRETYRKRMQIFYKIVCYFRCVSQILLRGIFPVLNFVFRNIGVVFHVL
jgi:hypothetical protein